MLLQSSQKILSPMTMEIQMMDQRSRKRGSSSEGSMPKEYVRDALPAEKPAFMPGTQKEWERFRSSHSGDRCTKMGEFVYEIETDFESGGDTLVGIHVSHDGRTIFLNHRHSMPDGILTLLEYVQMVGF